MKRLPTWTYAVIMLVFWSGLASAEPQAPSTPVQIMVTFQDRSLLRTEFGQPGQTYLATTPYASSSWSKRVVDALAREHRLEKSVEWPIRELGVHCVVYTAHDERELPHLLAELAQDARVSAVQPLNTFRVLSSDPYRPLQSNLTSLSVTAAHRWAQGRGVTVAVVDTGIDSDHPDLRGQVTQAFNLVDPDNSRPTHEIHGTAVAGIIAASADNGQGIVGVAPGARLLSLKACWPLRADAAAAECNSLTLARALTQVLQHKPQVLNLSLNGPHDPLLSALLKMVLAQGTVVVAAEPRAGDIGFPTDVDQVIRVNPERVTAPLANLDVFNAPGSKVLTTFPDGAYSFVNGSSFAAAHVSGVVALIKELKPSISTAEVHQVLRESRANYGVPTLQAEAQGAISACKALTRVETNVQCDPEIPTSPVSRVDSTLSAAALSKSNTL